MNEAKIADRVAKSVIAASLSVPIFTEGRAQKRLQKWIPFIELALRDKHIWNVDFKKLKEGINRAFEDSREEINKYYRKNHSDEPSVEEWQSMTNEERANWHSIWRPHSETPFEIRGLKKFLRGLKKYNGPMKREFDKWANAWLTYQDAIASLKPYIEKGRKPDPNKPVKERYEAPRTSTGGVRMIREALKKVVAGQGKQLSDRFTESYMRAAQTFLEKRQETDSPYKFFKADPEGRAVVDRMVEETTGSESYPRAIKVYQLKSDAEATARKFADGVVKDMVERYLVKNTNKIGSVVERKGGLEKIEVKHGRLKGWGFSGEMVCHFSDGTQFTVRNKAVYHYNYRGADYVQFPTTFHQVVWPDGKKSAMLSEKQMNEEWAKA